MDIRIRCPGFLDEKLNQLSRLDKAMDDVESFANKRSGFEIVSCKDGLESFLFVAGLFRETPEVGMEGWFVWQYLETTRHKQTFCLNGIPYKEAAYKHALLYGAPQRIHSSAILTRTDAKDLIKSLIAGTINDRFNCLSYAAIVEMSYP